MMMYTRVYSEDDYIDPGNCTFCGKSTSLLVSFRCVTYLVDACGNCIKEMQIGYDAMMANRMKFKIRPEA